MTLRPHELLTVLQGARHHLESLRLRDPAITVCIAGLARMEAVLAQPPRVVILGEVNSGKTSVADVLLGVGLLPASVVANTRLPVLIRYAETTALYAIGDNMRRPLTDDDLDDLATMELKSLEIGLPSDHLMDLEILDTPALSEGDGVEVDGDIRVWCTVATRAWTESERAYWSSLPRRCWRNALLVATHKDALEDPGDAAKIERRLRAVAGDMFRDVILVSATDAGKSRRSNGRPSDASAIALIGQIRVWATEIRDRRARKIEKIVRRLARLAFHQLGRASLKSAETRVLRDWEAECAKLVSGLDATAGDLPTVVQKILRRFAQSLEEVHPGSIERSTNPLPATAEAPRRAAKRGAAARRYAQLIVADLTALLRFELARTGLRDSALSADYATARAILLPLAQLDSEFEELERLVVPPRKAAAAAMLPSDEELLASVARAR